MKKIELSDAAIIEQIKGLIAYDKLFNSRGAKSPSSFDFNDAGNGVYTINANEHYENMPVDKYGCLVSFVDEPYYGMQIYIPIEPSTTLYVRVRGSKDSGWKSWRSISLS